MRFLMDLRREPEIELFVSANAKGFNNTTNNAI